MNISAPRQAGIIQGVILSLATFLPIMATLSVAPAIPRLLEHFSDVPNVNVLVPMLMSVPAICIAAVSPFCGVLVDRLGRRNLLLWAVVLYGICGMAPLFMEDLYFILATRVGVGIAEAMLVTAGKTLIGDYFAGVRRQRWVGYQNAIDASLGSLTWLVGGMLAAIGWRSPFLLYLLSIPLFFAVAFFIWEPVKDPVAEGSNRPDKSHNLTPFPWRQMVLISLVTMFAAAMYFSYPVNIARALTELGAVSGTNIGVLTAIASLGTPLGSLVFARLTGISAHKVIVVGIALVGISFVGIGFSESVRQATVAGFFEQIGNGLLGAAFTAWCLNTVPAEHRGRAMGIMGSFLVSGIFLSPLIVAGLQQTVGTVQNSLFVLGCGSIVGAIVIGLVMRRYTTPESGRLVLKA